MRLYKGSANVIARQSPNALYREELVSFNEKSIDQHAADVVLKYHGFQSRAYRKFIRTRVVTRVIYTVVVYSERAGIAHGRDSNVDDEFDKMLADAIRRYRKTLEIMAEM